MSSISLNRLVIILSLLVLPLKGEWTSSEGQAPIHEAFVTKTGGSILLRAADREPPAPRDEQIPERPDSEAQWIGGYWDLNADGTDFVWVCGVWRQGPPDQQWIEGYWSNESQGWTRIPGFWSALAEDKLAYIDTPPPESIVEDIGKSPSKDMFFVPGYWQWDNAGRTYTWLSGKWESLDEDWVLVPAHYLWTPKGYLLISAYWDYPIDNRGTAYSCSGSSINTIEPAVIIESLFCCYPDYLYLFHHHWCFHPDYWIGNPLTPPWWGWDSWWGLPWCDQWGMWWWWGHPGFPQPIWLDLNITLLIGVPPHDLLDMFFKMHRPLFITDFGVLSASSIAEALKQPILKPDSNLDDLGKKELKLPETILKPSGSEDSLRENMRDQIPLPPGALDKPPRQREEQRVPSIPQPSRPEVTLPPRPQQRPSTPRPEQQRPYSPRPEQQRPYYPRPEQERPYYPRPDQQQPRYPRPEPQRPYYPRPEQERPHYPRPEQHRPHYPRPEQSSPQTFPPYQPQPGFRPTPQIRPEFRPSPNMTPMMPTPSQPRQPGPSEIQPSQPGRNIFK